MRQIIEIRDRKSEEYIIRLIIDTAALHGTVREEEGGTTNRVSGQDGWEQWFCASRKPIAGRELLLAPDISVESIAVALAYLGVANEAAYQVARWSQKADQVANGVLPTLIGIMVKSCYKVYYRAENKADVPVSDRASSKLRSQFWSSLKELEDADAKGAAK